MTNQLKLKRTDDSNPQQGSSVKTQSDTTKTTTTTTTTSFKIPPNKKDNRKLFVGGLPPEVTDVEFRAFFEQFGPILDSVVMFDRETRCSRGFGFVTFEESTTASNLIANNIQEDSKSKVYIAGKWCEIKASEPKRGYYGRHGEEGRGVGGGRGRSLVSTPATSGVSSRNSSIETSARTEVMSDTPKQIEVKRGTNLGEEPGLEGPYFNNHQYYSHNHYRYHPNTMPHQYPIMSGYMPPNYPGQFPGSMNMGPQAPYMYNQPPQGPPMVAYNDVNMTMYPPQYGGTYGHGQMYQYPPMQVMPPQMMIPHDDHPSELIQEEQGQSMAYNEE